MAKMKLLKHYNSKESEKKWQHYWEKNNIYKFNPNSKKPIFSVDTPPPTISGKLHMGHAFGDSQQDFFVRYKRMKGFNVLNPFGTDNNGLPTLRLVEKEKKVNSKNMSREAFIKLCNKTIEEEFIPLFLKDSKRLGISADWNIFYSTIDDRSRKISQKSFIDLYKKGREYRIEAPALWCTECQTTIAQVELEDKELPTTFSNIIFKVDGKNLIISTTRPELLAASIAIFYHPEDKRYKTLKGKKAKVPLFNFKVPILEDKRVDMTKGTGITYCASFGDKIDMEWQKAHNLKIKQTLNKNGTLNKLAGKYEGLKVEEARKKIIEDLKKQGLLLKQEKAKHIVNTHERCGTPIEIIVYKQWFIKYLDLKKEMLKWGNHIKWYPKHMKNRYDNWVKGLQWDWCISRQIPFGIPFPVWYCSKCDEIILAEEKQLPVDPIEIKPLIKQCPKCKSKEFTPEKDIMNTWTTSALTPTIVKDLLKGTKAYKKIENKPMNIRRNGADIITFWNFNTMVKSQLHYKINPWKEVFINGWILGKDGKKMSKSRGNVISPQETIENYSADILRYLSGSVTLGETISFSEKELITGKKLVTKLWNASKFSLSHLKNYKLKKVKLQPFDSWLLSKLNNLIKETTNYFDNYNTSQAKKISENFFWHTFCDNYLEIIKTRLYSPTKKQEKSSAQFTLYTSLLTILKLFAPIMPHITEEIYQLYFKKYEKEKSIHLSEFPKYNKDLTNKKLEKQGDEFIKIISKVRQFKTSNQQPLKKEIILSLPSKYKSSKFLPDLKAVTNASKINFATRLKIIF